MPSIKELFVESCEAFKGSFGNVFILSLIGSVFGFMVMGVVFVSVAGMGFFSAITETMSSEMEITQKMQNFFTSERLVQTGIMLGLLFLVATIWGSIVRIAVIAAVGKYKERISLGSALKIGLTTFVPVFIMTFIVSLIVMGSWFALIIPGILVGLYLQYVSYEMIIGGKKWWNAVRGSVQIMSQNFGEVLLRMIVLYLVAGVVFYLPLYLIGMIAGNSIETATTEALSVAMIMSPIRFILTMILGYFSMAYSVTTYLHAKESTREDIAPSVAWMLIVSLLGWVIGVIVINSGMKLGKEFLSNDVVQKQIQEARNEVVEKELTSETERIEAWKAKMDPQAKVLYEQSQEKFVVLKNVSKTAKNQTEIKKVNDENIKLIKRALEIDKNNAELWNTLGDSYTWLSTDGTLLMALEAYEKAEMLDGNIWNYAYGSANVLQMLGRHDEAIIKYQKVIRMEDNFGRAHIALGVSYKAVGIKDLAKEELQKGIDMLSKYNTDGSYDVEILNARKAIGSL